ncbi:MAG: DUF2809 domain-containing protein [Rubripirellula sp.]
MKPTQKRRSIYAAAAAVVLVLGLASRHAEFFPPVFIKNHAGDAFWAALVYLLLSFFLPQEPLLQRVILALACAFTIELSQLYHAPWITALRKTTLGGLVLGFDFTAMDLVRYSVGILCCAAFKSVLRSETQINRQ